VAFETYMIGDAVKNLTADGAVTGFRIPIRIPYYRGVVLSLIEDFEVTVDGERFPRDAVHFTVRDKTLTLDEVAHDGVTRWEFGEWAALDIAKPGGLDAGEHDVELVGQFRISYLPWPMRPEASKRVQVAA
jgi:Domain of unknown function (DUF6379)